MALSSVLFFDSLLELQVLTFVHKLDEHDDPYDVEEENVQKALLIIEVLVKA